MFSNFISHLTPSLFIIAGALIAISFNSGDWMKVEYKQQKNKPIFGGFNLRDVEDYTENIFGVEKKHLEKLVSVTMIFGLRKICLYFDMEDELRKLLKQTACVENDDLTKIPEEQKLPESIKSLFTIFTDLIDGRCLSNIIVHLDH